MGNYLDVLKYELEAQYEGEELSFLSALHVKARWSKTAFYRLTEAMLKACIAGKNDGRLERWVASGFFITYEKTQQYVANGRLRKEHSKEYYDAACELLSLLCYYYFMGQSPFISNDGFEKFLAKIATEPE